MQRRSSLCDVVAVALGLFLKFLETFDTWRFGGAGSQSALRAYFYNLRGLLICFCDACFFGGGLVEKLPLWKVLYST